MIVPLDSRAPQIASSCFVAPDAWIIGDVTIDEDVSVFFGAVLRGDLEPIRVGRGTNLQEHVLLHTTHGRTPTLVGEHVTVGHRAILHGCTVGNRSLIGMGAIVLDGASIGEECVIGAAALITEGTIIPPRSLVVGVPGRVVRTLGDEDAKRLKESASRYIATGRELDSAISARSRRES